MAPARLRPEHADLRPASLNWTQRRLRERTMVRPPNLTYVPVDLESQHIGEQLDACGFERELVSFCSVLGVIHYLTADSVDSLLRFAATLEPGSTIVLSFVTFDDELNGPDLDASVRGVARTEGLGEPWKFRKRATDFVNQLYDLGFRQVFHLTPEMAQKRYFQGRQDHLRAPRWEQLIAATV
jgi:O-methyltransferase involved in polyketide biosynthesis